MSSVETVQEQHGEKSEEKQEKPKRKRWKRLFWFLFFVAVVIGIYFLLSKLLFTKGVGVVRQSVPEAVIPAGMTREPKQFDGKYVSFSFSAPYTKRLDTIDDNGPDIERILLDQEDKPKHSIAVIIEKRDVVAVTEDPSYQSRMNDPKTYVREDLSEGEYHGGLFTKEGTAANPVFEVAAFFTYKGYIVSMTTTAALSGDGLREDLMAAIRSLHFN